MLLTMAGRCNAGGMVFLTENIAYTPKMLADELDFEENTVLLALANMPRTLALGMLNGISILLTVKFIFPLFFLPALASLLSTLLLEPMFKPYMPKEIPEDAA